MKTFVIGDVHGRSAQLRRLVEMLPRDPDRDTLVLLGDLIDRGEDVPGAVEEAMHLEREAGAAPVVVLRGNHEQMLLDFIDKGDPLWLSDLIGSENTFAQYTGHDMGLVLEDDLETVRGEIATAVPPAHLEFLRQRPLYYEDDYALYVHAGLDSGKHPRDTDPQLLLWTRSPDFFRFYYGKPCIFGHTPTQFLPLLGRLGRHGIYISHSAIGIDTGYNYVSPLTCLSLPDFTLYQTFADGRSVTYCITMFIPEPFRALRKELALR
ncbi:MAG: metallophosphoesterase [Pyrinomonadaceae bacterium]|nr:metallophosphoesterase [Pyrinomonadaceae bacterium]